MSTKVTKVAIFHNTPGGGGIRLLNQVHNILEKLEVAVDQYTITETSEDRTVNPYDDYRTIVKPWKGFFQRLMWIYTILPSIHKDVAHKINQKRYDLVIVTHDYFTKSPYICRYLEPRIHYILHEPQREFYEDYHFHSMDLKDLIANMFRIPIMFIERINTKYVDRIYSNSKYSQQVIKEVFGRDSVVVYPKVDTKYFCPEKRVKKEKIILSVGGLSKTKGHDFVIRSLAEILGEYTLVIVGSGRKKDIKYLRTLAPSKNKFIKFISGISDNKMLDLYRKASVLCIGSHLEPFGLTSIESQSVGTPVVGVAEGGLLENIVDGETGYLVPRDPKIFLSATKKAMANSEALGKMARFVACQKWDIENLFEDVKNSIMR